MSKITTVEVSFDVVTGCVLKMGRLDRPNSPVHYYIDESLTIENLSLPAEICENYLEKQFYDKFYNADSDDYYEGYMLSKYFPQMDSMVRFEYLNAYNVLEDITPDKAGLKAIKNLEKIIKRLLVSRSFNVKFSIRAVIAKIDYKSEYDPRVFIKKFSVESSQKIPSDLRKQLRNICDEILGGVCDPGYIFQDW